ncbi:hypothetical protein Pchl3084_0777 [Pseudomonas chlororaphis subsp. aureofaciens 30-84]|nr:hypothetical protein Pchl3084_0777 [Pseudomonas chlororaphis subsp. aureofaciens 30-84]
MRRGGSGAPSIRRRFLTNRERGRDWGAAGSCLFSLLNGVPTWGGTTASRLRQSSLRWEVRPAGD